MGYENDRERSSGDPARQAGLTDDEERRVRAALKPGWPARELWTTRAHRPTEFASVRGGTGLACVLAPLAAVVIESLVGHRQATESKTGGVA